jgi:transcriptional regulator with XRE-family HTH domain
MDSQVLAAYVDQWLVGNSLSQNDLMHKAGLAGTFLTGLRRGADPKLGSLEKLAAAMNKTLPQLLIDAGLGGPPAERVDMLELIRTDPDLLPEARRHFADQYGLLRRLNQNGGSGDTDGGH